MGNGNCAVIGCHNNSKGLKNWKETFCDIKEHGNIKKKSCGCTPPFELFMFPSILRYNRKREAWIKTGLNLNYILTTLHNLIIGYF